MDASDADTSDSENDSAQDEDSVQVSRSAHFSMFLTSAAMASPPDAEEEDENDENEKNKAIVGDEAEEDNFERILGDSYETVGIKKCIRSRICNFRDGAWSDRRSCFVGSGSGRNSRLADFEV